MDTHRSEWAQVESRADGAYGAGRLAEAYDLYQQVLALNPERAWAYARAGAILAQQGNLSAARAALENALRLDESLPAAHSNLGNVYYTEGEYQMAITCYQRALSLAPNNPVFNDNLHAAYRKSGELNKAVAAYKQARRLERQLPRDQTQGPPRRLLRPMGCATVGLILFLSGLILTTA